MRLPTDAVPTSERPWPALRRAGLAALVFATALLPAAERLEARVPSNYLLAGSPDGATPLVVDDGLDVYLNEVLIYTDLDEGSGPRSPIPFQAELGDVLRLVVRDTYGDCASLTPVYLVDSAGQSAPVTGGFDGGCGNGPGDRGVVFEAQLVIVDLTPRPEAFASTALPGSAFSGVVQGPGGYLYGVTYDGGAFDLGTIYRATPDLSEVVVLHSFTGGADGDTPYGDLTVIDSLLFGVAYGGVYGGGLIFSFDPATLVLTPLHSFSFYEPYNPEGPLLRIGDFLYGSAKYWPGSVFRMRLDGSDFTTLHAFAETDGILPGALTPGPGGYLYGTALYGGLPGCYPSPYNGCGTIFRLRPDGSGQGASGFEVVYRFQQPFPGGFPQRKLVAAADGRLYGTTFRGMFSIAANPAFPDFQLHYTIPSGTGSSQIFAPPTEVRTGRIFFPRYDGGPETAGSVDSMTKTGGDVTIHHEFSFLDGGYGPYGILFEDASGSLFGTTEYSVAGPGTLYRLDGVLGGPPSGVPTTTTVNSSLNPSGVGDPVTFTVAVTGLGGPPTGSVQLRDSGAALGAPLTLVAGATSFSISSLSGGTHRITAEYLGDATFAGSLSPPLDQVVVRATTTVTLTSSANPSIAGQPVTFTATVGGFGPTGNVQFFDFGGPLGTVPLNGTQATLTTGALFVGQHTITAQYLGDVDNLASTSAPLDQVVDPEPRPPIPQPITDQTVVWGRPVVLTATAFDPDGDPLTFSLVVAPAGASITPGGAFSWTPSSAQIGVHPVTVRVSDGALDATTSFTVTVTRRPTRLTYTGPFQAAPGNVVLSAELRDLVDGVVANEPLAGKTVLLTIGTQSVTPVTDGAGLATATLALSQPGGTVGGTATFAGDALYFDAATPPFFFYVNPPPTIGPVAQQQTSWGQLLTLTVPASDPQGDPLAFSLVTAPLGMGMSANGFLSWIPTVDQLGDWNVTVGVTDGLTTVTTTFTVRVVPRLTTIVDLGPPTAPPFLATTFSARLVDAVLGTPLSGRSLTFSADGKTASAVTASNGTAAAPLFLARPAGSQVALTASFGGAPVYAASTATLLVSLQTGDSDGDGLPDEWETTGLLVGGVFVDLPAMGANPFRKDVFVHADWMVRPPTCIGVVCWGERSFAPQPSALAALVAAFEASPVPNPDGSTGITLHVDAGPASVMNPKTGATWGALSRAGVVTHVPVLGTAFDFGGFLFYDWSAVDQLKLQRFGAARAEAFHYALYADRLPVANILGISRDIPAADFLLVAGHPDLGDGMSIAQERGIFLHELGHNLKLRHGGGDDVNNKPNYTSVLNYRWALSGLPPDGRSDYSRQLEPAVDETVTGDANGDGVLQLLVGFEDWPNLGFRGGAIGDLLAPPPPMSTPADDLDPQELRDSGGLGRAGDGSLRFLGPTVLVSGSGSRALWVSVTNPAASDASFVVAASIAGTEGEAVVAVPAGGKAKIAVPVETDGLAPGELLVELRLLDSSRELVDRAAGRLFVLDLSTPEAQQEAGELARQLAELGDESGLDAEVRDLLVAMLGGAEPYRFEGFFPPVAMSPPGSFVWNTMTVPRTVPLKWRLTESGRPVLDPSSVLEVVSTPIDCTSLAITGPSMTEGTGGWTLTSADEGAWQYDWKTRKEDRGTCRRLAVRFRDGSESPPVHFRFR